MAASIVALSIAGTTQQANAALVKWTLNDFAFDDGGTASGSFIWDSSGSSINEWNISTTAGTVFGAFSYSDTIANQTAIGTTQGVDTFVLFRDDTAISNRIFGIGLDALSDLNTAVGNLALTNLTNVGAGMFFECINCTPIRSSASEAYLSGEVVVPLPAALPLLMSALGFFGFFGWRRKRMAVA